MKKFAGICGIVSLSFLAVIVSCGGDSSSGPSGSLALSSGDVSISSCSTEQVEESSSSAKEHAKDSSTSTNSAASKSSADAEKAPTSSSSEAFAASSDFVESSSSESGSSDSVQSSANSSSSVFSASSSALSSSQNASGDDGVCENCDSFTAADPTLTENGGYGSVTTYGSVTEKEASSGGACNYGKTNIHYYAAIHVNVSPGDNLGPWQGGSACGGCVHVKARTPEGWKEVTVRIMDRCPDANCGVDLGGAPASEIKGNRVGRYSGEWEFVSCEGVEGVWDDSTSVWVKEGASTFWSIIQVRNPKDAVKSMTLKGVQSNDAHVLEMVVGTENFWTVPPEVLQTDNEYSLTVTYRSGEPDTWLLKGSELSVGEANLYLNKYRTK